MRFKLFISIISIFVCFHTVRAQNFFFGGYTVGKYLVTEPAPEVMAAKFNLGWDVSISEDQRKLKMIVGNPSDYTLDSPFEWKDLPVGATFGYSSFDYEKKLGVMTRISFLNNKSGGERTNSSTGITEKLAFKTRSMTFALNFVHVPFKFIQPFAGFEMGSNTMRYSYDNGTLDINNKKLGYKVKIGGDRKPGGRGINMRLNAGTIIRVFQTDKIGLHSILQYQYVLPFGGDINNSTAELEDVETSYYFNHNNISLSLALTIQLDKL